MAKNIKIAGASYSSVPSIKIPLSTGGGDATFYDCVGSKDIIANENNIDVTGLASVNVNVASSGGGLEFESGTYSPSEDIARPTINFSKTHGKPPAIVVMSDATESYHTASNSNYCFSFFDFTNAFNGRFPYSSNAYRCGYYSYVYRANSTSSVTTGSALITYAYTNSGSSSASYSRYFATESAFMPYSGNTSRYWRAGRVYKWYAIWTP